MAELQKTAEDGATPPAVTRSESRASNLSYVPSVSRRASKPGGPSSVVVPTHMPSDPQVRSPSRASPAPAGTAPPPSRSSSAAAALRRTPSGFRPAAEQHPAAVVAQPIPEEVAEARPASVGPSLAGSEGPQRNPVPGVVSYSSPQTLIGQHEMLLRNKSQGSLLAGTPEPAPGPGSDGGSLYKALSVADADDIPLSQRKQIMRQSSLMSLPQSNASHTRLPSAGHDGSEGLGFNSHQPRQLSVLPSAVAREAQLASFRQSVQHDLRAGTPVMATSGRETPFAPSSLLGNREAEVQRNIKMQRNVLMGQKEAEAQRKELKRRECEVADRVFDERMRSGDLLDAHREAMRKLQRAARDR